MVDVAKNIVMKPINEVKPYIRNPRRNEKTVKVLVDIIPVVGFNQPIVVDKKGIIVKGHARYAAAIQLGMTEVPCIVTDADEEAIKLDRIADNKISELSEWVNDDLLHEVDMLNIDFDLSELGLPVMDFDEFEEPVFDDDKQEKYRQFLEERQQKEEARIEKAIEKAEERVSPKYVAEEQKKSQKYYKVICPDCGKVIYVREGEAVWEDMSQGQ